MREISVDGCPVIGRGAIGTVYRLDADTIVKVYGIPDSLEMIEKEQQRAKQALILGIPTAISYDVVRVGDKYGSVFEMVQAENCNDLIVKAPEKLEEILPVYVDLLRTVHRVEIPPDTLPSARDVYIGYVDQLAGVLPEAMAERLKALLRAMPEDLHAVHGDIQMKNVMMSQAEPLLIDMETLCVGNPVFDFAGLYTTYCAFPEDDPLNSMEFLGISQEISNAVYHKTLKIYLSAKEESAVAQAAERIELVGSIRFLYLLAVLKLGKPELLGIRIRHTLDRLDSLLHRVDRLDI